MRIGRARKARRIQEALDEQKPERVSFADIARDLGVSYQLVWRTANGLANNRRILRRFLALGANPADMDLPKDVLEQQEVA